MNTTTEKVYSAVGFYLSGSLGPEAENNGISACNQALRHFPWLRRKRLQYGVAQLELWSHHDPQGSVYIDKLKNLFVLIGSPMNSVLWEDVVEQLAKQGDDAFELPWEGRCILIRLSLSGKDWTMWNDWCGSIPVFHTIVQGVPVASSLEPSVVAAAGFTPDDFSKRGIVEMLVHGHFLGTDTLFTKMQTLIPDSVSHWRNGGFIGSRKLWTVEPSDIRWGQNWNKLIEEMHEYTFKALGDAFRQQDKWILPLSGGMDSRLIACVGLDIGIDMQAFTYGPIRWNETIYAEKVARALGIPWQRVDLGTDYLADYTSIWLDWFGSSLHTHGMYQMPFLECMREKNGSIVTGFIGDPLGGLQVVGMAKSFIKEKKLTACFTYKWEMWPPDFVGDVLLFDPEPYLQEQEQMLNEQMALLKGTDWQRRWFLFQWNHVFRFSYYQPMMYNYWKDVSTPYMNREYARFCLSLPRFALEERRLQKAMLRRYWPEVAGIRGTYSRPPFIEAGRFTAKRIASRLLPWKLMIALVRSFGMTPNTMELDCVKTIGWESLYPLSQDFNGQGIINTEIILQSALRAQNYSQKDYNKVCAAQCIIYRMLQGRKGA